MASHWGFAYKLVTYKWPSWLRKQEVKQRQIWGYKILFLDVLFPLGVKKVIFVDADQVCTVCVQKNGGGTWFELSECTFAVCSSVRHKKTESREGLIAARHTMRRWQWVRGLENRKAFSSSRSASPLAVRNEGSRLEATSRLKARGP